MALASSKWDDFERLRKDVGRDDSQGADDRGPMEADVAASEADAWKDARGGVLGDPPDAPAPLRLAKRERWRIVGGA